MQPSLGNQQQIPFRYFDSDMMRKRPLVVSFRRVQKMKPMAVDENSSYIDFCDIHRLKELNNESKLKRTSQVSRHKGRSSSFLQNFQLSSTNMRNKRRSSVEKFGKFFSFESSFDEEQEEMRLRCCRTRGQTMTDLDLDSTKIYCKSNKFHKIFVDDVDCIGRMDDDYMPSSNSEKSSHFSMSNIIMMNEKKTKEARNKITQKNTNDILFSSELTSVIDNFLTEPLLSPECNEICFGANVKTRALRDTIMKSRSMPILTLQHNDEKKRKKSF